MSVPFPGRVALRVLLALVASLIAAASVGAQSEAGDETGEQAVFKHNEQASWWISGQLNLIFQAHPAFPARYSGPFSLGPQAEHGLSNVIGIYGGVRLNQTTDVVVHLEHAGGDGINGGSGLAGYTNLDVVRNPSLRGKLYTARVMIRHVFALGGEPKATPSGPFSLVPVVPERRLEIRAGKFSTVDYFDVNEVGSDIHLQFMNYASDNNGAYDYAADTRGYTIGVLVEYITPGWALRFGEGLMPTTANGNTLDWNLRQARAENVELEIRRGLVRGHEGRVRLLGWVNHARMGRYADAVAAFKAGLTPQPDIVFTRRPGTVKYGAGLNIEQPLGHGLRVFGRAGWDDGQTETFAYTEIDRTGVVGADSTGQYWHRPKDKVGIVFITNGLAAEHREYLTLGGSGFQLGDGGLTYGHEQILEMYYTVPVVRGVFASVDLQRIVNPGYNQDRGPVLVTSVRLHFDF